MCIVLYIVLNLKHNKYNSHLHRSIMTSLSNYWHLHR